MKCLKHKAEEYILSDEQCKFFVKFYQEKICLFHLLHIELISWCLAGLSAEG